MAKSLRHAIGMLQLISIVYSLLFLLHAVRSQEASGPRVFTLIYTPAESLGCVLLVFWLGLVLWSGGHLFREGRPARRLNAAALCFYGAGIALFLASMPAYHGVILMRYGIGMYVLALTPLASVADIVLPPYRQAGERAIVPAE